MEKNKCLRKINRAVIKKGKSNSEAQFIINKELNDRKDNYIWNSRVYSSS